MVFSEKSSEKCSDFVFSPVVIPSRSYASFYPDTAGLSYKFIGEVERGTVNPSLDSLINIAVALDISIKDLFPNEHDLIMGFTHDDLKTIRKAVKLLNSRLNVKHVKA